MLLYEDTIISLSRKTGRQGTLTNRWVKSYMGEVEKAKKDLRLDIARQVIKSTKDSAEISSSGQMKLMNEILNPAGMQVNETFINMLSRVNDNVVKDIISGELYKDNRTISSRIWSYGEEFERDLQYTINQALLEKKSAIELASDLEKYVEEPARRDSDWGKAYPKLRNKRADYNAIRLARTSINHAYQNATIQSSSMNPFVEGIQWVSAEIHGRTCQLCIDRATQDSYGLGPGVFPINSVPIDHPNGLCTMQPHTTKTLNETADELRSWVYGGDNPKLDKWFAKYGEEFI